MQLLIYKHGFHPVRRMCCYFYCSCCESTADIPHKLIIMLLFNRCTVKTQQPIRKQCNRTDKGTSKEKTRHCVFCLLFQDGNKLSPALISSFFDLLFPIIRDRHICVMFSIHSSSNKTLMYVGLSHRCCCLYDQCLQVWLFLRK